MNKSSKAKSTTGKGLGRSKLTPSDIFNRLYTITLRVPMLFVLDTLVADDPEPLGGYEALTMKEQDLFVCVATKTIRKFAEITGFKLSDVFSYYTVWDLFDESVLNIRLVASGEEQRDLKTFGIECLECFLSLFKDIDTNSTYYCPTYHCMTWEEAEIYGTQIPYDDVTLSKGRTTASRKIDLNRSRTNWFNYIHIPAD